MEQEQRERVILHLDCDEFFMQVHERASPQIAQEIANRACIVYQYNDVICINTKAKQAGVTKRQRAHEARSLLEKVNGRMIHAYWRQWPGKRVVYTPYQRASRDIFDSIESFLQTNFADSRCVVERASIDECYIDCTALRDVGSGENLACALRQFLLEEKNLRVSIGVSFNRLLAKLASTQAKKIASAQKVKAVIRESCRGFLRAVPATKLPGLGRKEVELANMRATLQTRAPSGKEEEMSIACLQNFTQTELRESLKLKTDAAAQQIWENCRGQCNIQVQKSEPPKRVGVTSWIADGRLGDLARKDCSEKREEHAVFGAGKWVFEPDAGPATSSPVGVRWILLALALDLAERVDEGRALNGEVPTSITVGVTQYTNGWDEAGTSSSRSRKLPSELVALFEHASSTLRIADVWSAPQQAAESDLVVEGVGIGLGHSAVRSDLQDSGYHMRCVHGIVDAAAEGVLALAKQDGPDTVIRRLTLTATNFCPARPSGSIAAWLAHASEKQEAVAAPSAPAACSTLHSSAAALLSTGAFLAPASPPGRASVLGSAALPTTAPGAARQAAAGVDRQVWTELPAHIQAELAASPSAVQEQERLLALSRGKRRHPVQRRLDSFFTKKPR